MSACSSWCSDTVTVHFFQILPTGTEKKTRTPDEEANWVTAIHEAGHAIVGLESKSSASKVYKATIMKRGQALGHVSCFTFC